MLQTMQQPGSKQKYCASVDKSETYLLFDVNLVPTVSFMPLPLDGAKVRHFFKPHTKWL